MPSYKNPPSLLYTRMRRLVNITITLLLLGAVSAQYISPEKWILPSYLGLLFPLWLILFLGITVASLVRGDWLSLGIKLILLVSVTYSINTYIPLRFRTIEAPQEHTDTLRILSFNVQAFEFRSISERQKHPTIEYIRQSNADIVCLQEAFLSEHSLHHITAQNIRKLCPEYPYFSHLKAQKSGSRLAILSKYPVSKKERLSVPSLLNGGVLFHVDLGKGRQLALYNLHLESFRISNAERKAYLHDASQGISGTTRKVHRKLSPSYRKRAIQADRIAEHIQAQETPYIVVCGDFNDTPISYVHKRIERTGLTDAYYSAGKGPGFSFDLPFNLGVRIDHFFCSQAFMPLSARVDRKVFVSDHKPLLVTLVYK